MDHPWLIWVIAIVTGICHATQAAMADYYRQFHLFFLKGESGSELEKSENLDDTLKSLSWKKDFWRKLTLTFYTGYTRNQERRTPAMQALRQELSEKWPGEISMSFRRAFRRASLPLMKYTNILSFNWRSIALFVAIFAQMPWLYFAFELVVLNILLIYMVCRHEAICRKLLKEVKDGEFDK